MLVLNGRAQKRDGGVGGRRGLDSAVATLLRPQLRLLGLTLPGMRSRGWGRVLAVGSSGVAAPLPNLALSNLGRAALAGHQTWRRGRADGVTVNMLLPGRIATDRVAFLDEAAAKKAGTSVDDAARSRAPPSPPAATATPPSSAPSPRSCAAPASYVTGTALRVDGGLVRSL